MTTFRWSVSLMFVVCGAAVAQLTESYDAASPESQFGPIPHGSMTVVAPRRNGAGGITYSSAALSIPPLGGLDAFSEGLDYFPPFGPASFPSPVTCRTVHTEFSVDRASPGAQGSGVVYLQAIGNGAASDTFRMTWTNTGLISVVHATDALSVTPRGLGVNETDIDAITWTERERYPAYFSVDPPTAALMGRSPADILVVAAPFATPEVFLSEADLGLMPGDDVDAVAVNRTTGLVVYSVSRPSPSALGTFGGVVVGPAGLLISGGGGQSNPWALDYQLALMGPFDDLNALRITDPMDESVCSGTMINPVTGFPFSGLEIDGSDGGPFRRLIDVTPGSAFTLGFDLPIFPGNPYPAAPFFFILGMIGVPCPGDAQSMAPLPGIFAFSLTCLNPAPTFTLMSSLPFGTLGCPGPLLPTATLPFSIGLTAPIVPFALPVTLQACAYYEPFPLAPPVFEISNALVFMID